MSKLKFLPTVVLAILLLPHVNAWGSALRNLEGDQILSADHTKTQVMPAASGTLLNTVSHIPVAGSLVQEIPSGTVNSSNAAFTLANTPGGSSSVLLFIDGMAIVQGTDYTITGASITMTTAPSTGQQLYAIYSKY